MKTLVGLLFLLLLAVSPAHARDGFEKVRCGGDIVKALVGQRADNETVSVIEARHKDLGLKDLGALESENGWFPITWLICGQEYMLIESDRADIVRDALPIPPHSKDHPEFQGYCKGKGVKMRDWVVAILRNSGGQDELPAEAAWKLDEKTLKFVKISTDDLACPRYGALELQSR